MYGLAADPMSDRAVAKIYETKSRPLEKPISVAVDSLSMAYFVGKLNDKAETLIQNFLPGPLTVIVEKRPIISDLLSAGTDNVGIRIPDHPIALGFIRKLGSPITSTSANISGGPDPLDVNQAVEQVGEGVEIALDAGVSKGGQPSTVVDVTRGLEIVRSGPISESDIRSVLKSE